MFHFLNYQFKTDTAQASFSYCDADGTPFTETIQFIPATQPIDQDLLDRALFLSFVLIGTSYYKAHPTPFIQLNYPLDKFQAKFFNSVYQEGLSQFAFENHLTRNDLAHFSAQSGYSAPAAITVNYSGTMTLQSGGKDSLLTATLFQGANPHHIYISNSEHHPSVISQLNGELQVIRRHLDLDHLRQAGGFNGHVPITYIIQSLALIQAILNHDKTILTSIGHEGDEAHAQIGNLPVNHQWSKTWSAELAFAEYVHHYISPDLNIGSPLRGYSELKIAELFTKHCWTKFGHSFSSCNVANYRQHTDNHQLTWCGECAKCANSYLLFAPFVPATDLDSLFNNQSLFTKPELINTFKGLLGVDGFMKPFECIGEIAELRQAYRLRLPEYSSLPFAVPPSDFDYQKTYPTQHFIKQLKTIAED